MLASNVRHWTLLVFIKLNYVLPERERGGGASIKCETLDIISFYQIELCSA